MGTRDDDQPSGIPWEHLDAGHFSIASAEERAGVYDTTLRGYGKGGHRFRDNIRGERRAVMEYLQTL